MWKSFFIYFPKSSIGVGELKSIMGNREVNTTGLAIHRLTFVEAVMMVVGATIGSGVLGLAYASKRAGWPILVFWLISVAVVSTVSMLYVAETSLRTRQPLQLAGLAEKYLGRAGSWLLFFSVGATCFCSLIAYSNGCGKILSDMFHISFYAGSLLFIVPASFVVWMGLKATGAAEKFISSGMIIILLILVVASFISSRVPLADILYAHWEYAMPIFNITIFVYAVQYIVPEVARGFRHQPEKLVPSIFIGFIIALFILTLVPLSVFLMLPIDEIIEVASLSWGRALKNPVFYLLVNIFAFCAMITSFWAIAESFLSNIVDKFHIKNERNFRIRLPLLVIIVVPPFLLAFFGAVSFVNAIYYAGTFGGIIMSVLPVFMLNQARVKGDVEPVWKCGWIAAPSVQWVLLIIFLMAALYTIFNMVGMLPQGW